MLAPYFAIIYSWQLPSSEKSLVGKKNHNISQGFYKFRFLVHRYFFSFSLTNVCLPSRLHKTYGVLRAANHSVGSGTPKNDAFFYYLGFLSRTFRIHGTQQGKGEGIYLTPLYHFHPLHRHLDISRVITAESSPLHIAGSRNRTGNLPLVSERKSLITTLRASSQKSPSFQFWKFKFHLEHFPRNTRFLSFGGPNS